MANSLLDCYIFTMFILMLPTIIIVLLSLLLSPEVLFQSVLAQHNDSKIFEGRFLKYPTYESSNLGIKFHYPSNWQLDNELTNNNRNCSEESVTLRCSIYFNILSGNQDDVIIVKIEHDYLSTECMPKCQTLEEFVRWKYLDIQQKELFYYSNKTSIIGNHSAWQMEYLFGSAGHYYRQSYVPYTLNNNSGYMIRYIANPGPQFYTYFDDVKKMIDSIEFTPAKRPSGEGYCPFATKC